MRGLKILVLVVGLIWAIGIAAAEPLLIDVTKVEAIFDQRTNEPVVSLKLSEKSAQSLAQITQVNVGRPMNLRVDGKVIANPIIRTPIISGSFQISGGLSAQQTKDIADRIKSGSKVEVELVFQ